MPELCARKPREAGVDVAGSRTHDQARGRSQAHGGVDALHVMNRGHAGAGAKMCQNHAAGGRLLAHCPHELFHQIRVRQAVESVPPNPDCLVPPRDRHDLRDPGHVVMKAGIEAGNLRQSR